MILRNKNIYYIYKYIRIISIPIIPFYLLFLYLIRLVRITKKANLPIICVGNITTGGTGKTPTVILLAELLKDEGFSPGIVSRGYKGTKSKEGAVIYNGKDILLTPEETGDEPYLMAMRLKDIPIAIGANRKKAIDMLIYQFNVSIIIMDDGLQNTSVYKDISIISIDATKPFGNGLLLPAGDLREPKSSIKRSNLILINKANLLSEGELLNLTTKIRKVVPHHLIFNGRYIIDYIVQINCEGNCQPISVIEGKRILLITAIANPNAFFEMIRRLHPENVKTFYYSDHYEFNYEDVKIFLKESENCDYAIVTEKDYIKLCKFNLNNKFHFLKITMQIDDHKIFTEHVKELIKRI